MEKLEVGINNITLMYMKTSESTSDSDVFISLLHISEYGQNNLQKYTKKDLLIMPHNIKKTLTLYLLRSLFLDFRVLTHTFADADEK